MIPLSVPNFEGNESKYVEDAVSQGWVSTGGAYVETLERTIAEYVGVPLAAACQSGTAAIHLSLVQAGVGDGDLVIAPTLTFIAAVNPIYYVHAEPVFMDCDDSLCMDPVKLEQFCKEECILLESGLYHKKSNKRVKAVIVVHVFGNMADMESIMKIAKEYKLTVIEDATEALGTTYVTGTYADKKAGTIGDFGAYSFNGNKIITTGGGGAAVSNDSEALKHLKYLSTQAKDDGLYYIHNEIGYNYRMTNVQAAIGVGQMELLEEFISRKNKNYDKYCELFESVLDVEMMPFRENVRSNKWFYALKINRDIDMKALIEKLQEHGIQTRPIWGLIHKQKPYKKYMSYNIEKAEFYSNHILNIPCSTNLKVSEIEQVVEAIKTVLSEV